MYVCVCHGISEKRLSQAAQERLTMAAFVGETANNLRSVENACLRVGADVRIVCSPGDVGDADGLILPGVGALQDCPLLRRTVATPCRTAPSRSASASTMLAKSGPLLNSNSRFPPGDSCKISVPVMSIGIRSGVNCTRLKLSDIVSASRLTNKVFASPGTPIRSE